MPARLTQDTFLRKAHERHGKLYDYSESVYTLSSAPLTIICPKHGRFEQTASSHLRGCGCPCCAADLRGQRCGGHNRLSLTDFIARATTTHDGFYDYSNVVYENGRSHVSIACPLHGEFWQSPTHHLMGTGCPKCARENTAAKLRMPCDEFDERVKHIHGGRITRTGDFTNYQTKCNFRCNDCGVERSSYPMSVIKGVGIGCRCTNFRRSTSDFLEDACDIHGGKYDYQFVDFKGIHNPVEIVCRKCNEAFYQTPANHIHKSCGCPKCGWQRSAEARTLSVPQFLARARAAHGERYHYDLNSYVNARTKMTIICPDHGPFEQIPFSHLKGHRCNKCGSAITGAKQSLSKPSVLDRLSRVHGNRLRIDGAYSGLNSPTRILCTVCGLHRNARLADLLNGDGIACKCSKTYRRNTELFIAEAIETHGARRYDYSAARFVTVKTPLTIRCNVCKCDFAQTPDIHLQGCGCPLCAQPKGERDVAQWLDDNGFTYEIQQTFETCKHYRLLPFDFYVPSHATLIEYDGAQHYRPVDWFGGEKAFKRTQTRDAIKNMWAANHGYTLIRIRYDEIIADILSEAFSVLHSTT
jgi:very-short-patch-repair endonuclease